MDHSLPHWAGRGQSNDEAVGPVPVVVPSTDRDRLKYFPDDVGSRLFDELEPEFLFSSPCRPTPNATDPHNHKRRSIPIPPPDGPATLALANMHRMVSSTTTSNHRSPKRRRPSFSSYSVAMIDQSPANEASSQRQQKQQHPPQKEEEEEEEDDEAAIGSGAHVNRWTTTTTNGDEDDGSVGVQQSRVNDAATTTTTDSRFVVDLYHAIEESTGLETFPLIAWDFDDDEDGVGEEDGGSCVDATHYCYRTG